MFYIKEYIKNNNCDRTITVIILNVNCYSIVNCVLVLKDRIYNISLSKEPIITFNLEIVNP